MRLRLSIAVATLLLLPTQIQAQQIQVGIGPSQAEITMGKDGLPVTIAPTLFFGAPNKKHVELISKNTSAGAPRAEFSSSTDLEADQYSTILPFTIIPTVLDATGTYDYEWKYRLDTTSGNIKVAIPFKLKVHLIEKEQDVQTPYLWYPINTTYTSPLESVHVPNLIVTQRQKDQPISIKTSSNYPRRISNLILNATLSQASLGELSTTSSIQLATSTGAIPFIIPGLPLGKSTLTFNLLDKSVTATILTLPTFKEFAALIALLISLLIASFFLSKKRTVITQDP